MVGATSQAVNPRTYSQDTAFVDANGRLNSAAPASDANDTTVATTKWVKDQSYVPTTRTINSKALSSNITLSASDVSALPDSTIIPTITDTYNATSSDGMSGKAVASAISGKQDTISDLATIRSGAEAGATALQQSDVTDTYSSTGTAPVNGTAVASAISGKQDSSTAVTHIVSTAVGSATNPVYIASDGTATATTYTLSKSVPSDAVFTDTTYSDFTGATSGAAGTSGLVPAPAVVDRAKFLAGDGTWATPTGTTYSDMTGATESAAGTHGLAPAPAVGDNTKFLRGDATWATIDALPSQTSQSGKFLTTNGTTASWATVDALPSQTSQSGKFLTTNGSTASWASLPIVDQTYSGTSTNAQSGVAVKSAIDSAISSVYKAAGSIAYASLPTPAKAVEGNVYNVTDAFTTDSRFVEGAGKSYPAGTNVVIINTSGTTYKFDVLTGMVDLSNYQTLITSTNKLNADLVDDSSSTNKFVTAANKTTWNNKQDAISDLATIRSGAEAGATALQPNTAITAGTHTKITYDANGLVTAGANLTASDIPDISATYQTKITSSNKIAASNISGLAAVATSNSYEDLIDKPYIPEGVIVDQTYSATSTNAQSGTAVAGAISTKQDTLVSGTNIKTINNNSILGSGNISVDSLPTQTGQSGKFLTTNGTAASWANVDALPSQTGNSGKYLTTNGTTASWGDTVTATESSLKTINGNSILGTGDITITSAPDLDETTINLNSNDELQAIGVIEKNAGAVKYDWVGTLAQWTAGRSGGTIPDSWICYITDDETTSVSVDWSSLVNVPTYITALGTSGGNVDAGTM